VQICTVEQAAEIMKLRPSTILRHIRKGKLQAKRFGHLSYRIAERSLELFLMQDEQPVSKKAKGEPGRT
jgi:excisionase family DNA binding protein